VIIDKLDIEFYSIPIETVLEKFNNLFGEDRRIPIINLYTSEGFNGK